MPETLTTTSYAILGLLALKPWTTYELAKQMDRGFRHFWPRAESKLYAEPPKLVSRGFAKATKDLVGRRPRTTYSITRRGRKALRDWLETPGSGPVLEFEALLKVGLGDQGSRDGLLGNIAAAREWAEGRLAEDAELVHGYLTEGPPFADRLAVVVLSGSFMNGFARFVREWSERADAQVREWPDDIHEALPDIDFMIDVVDPPVTG
jgi:PadR family transcriptional regulator, regulatory protein AphA